MENLILLIKDIFIFGVSNSRRILIILSLRIQSFFMRSPIDLTFKRSYRTGRKVKIRLAPKKPCKLHIGRNVNLEDYVTIELRGGEIILEDMDTGRTLSCPIAFVRREEGDPLPRLTVVKRAVAPEHYRFALDGLRRVLEASVRTGNPVVWS